MVKKIALKILLCIPFLFIKNVYAEDLNNIYLSYSNNRIIDSISDTSFGDYPEKNFILYNQYNVFLQYTGTTTTPINYLLLYNKQYDFYVYIQNQHPTHNVFRILDNATVPFALCSSYDADTSNCSQSNNYRFFYNNSDKLDNIYSFFNSGTLSSKNFENFYGSYYATTSACNTQCIQTLNRSLIYNISDFYFIDSNVSFYINGELQEKHTYSELNPIPEPEPEPIIPPYNFNDNKYYVPNYTKGNCVEIIDKDTIRVFEDENTSFYTDYFINSNYISKTGQVDLNYEKQCSTLEFTDIRYYGNDMPQILFILVCILTFTIGFPYVLYKRFRKR